MGYDRTVFGRGMGASILVLVVLVGLVLSTNTAYAMAVAGVGGFTVQADSITAEESLIYPGSGDSAGEGETAQILIEQRNVEIEGLVLTKEVDVSAVPGLDGTASLSVSSDETVTADEQLLKTSEINAEKSTFGPQVIKESETDEVEESFEIGSGDAAALEGETRLVEFDDDGPGQRLEDAELTVHYLASSTIEIPDLNVDIEYDGGS